MKTVKVLFIASVVSILYSTPGLAVDFKQYPALQGLVKLMVSEDNYSEQELSNILQLAVIDQKTLELMDRQYESLPWHKYRKIFINQNRIDLGVEFWQTHESTLNRAEEKYGVPPAVMVALIGVETHYGKRMGDKRVLDSLVTLSAAYERRSKFFTRELRKFIKLTKKENIDPTSVVGSFAGAIGIPQFMPSSYEAYSVDFNGNDQRDLVNEFEDAIGSVANYLHVHGWTRQQEIYANVNGSLSTDAAALVSKRAKLKQDTQHLLNLGINFKADNPSKKSALVSLTEENGKRYFVGFKNFYAITRYNPSVNYAMAVTELSEAIAKSRAAKN